MKPAVPQPPSPGSSPDATSTDARRTELPAALLAPATFADVPLPYVLVTLRNARASGMLEIACDDGRSASVAFWRGFVAAASSSPSIARFGSVAYELGIIGPALLDATTVESSHTRRMQEELLLERGSITDQQAAVVHAEQLKRRVHWLFTFSTAASFSFQEMPPSPTVPATRIEAIEPLWRGLSDFPPERRIQEVRTYVGERSLRVTSEAIRENAGLPSRENALCEMLMRGPATIAELEGASSLAPMRVGLLVYFLSLARCIELQDAPRAPSSSGTEWAAGASPSIPPRTSVLSMPPPPGAAAPTTRVTMAPPPKVPWHTAYPSFAPRLDTPTPSRYTTPTLQQDSNDEPELELAVEPRNTLLPKPGPA